MKRTMDKEYHTIPSKIPRLLAPCQEPETKTTQYISYDTQLRYRSVGEIMSLDDLVPWECIYEGGLKEWNPSAQI